MQLLQGVLGYGGLSAQDPAQLHAEEAKVGAAVDQRVALVVAGQHPVGTGGSWGDRSESQSQTERLGAAAMNLDEFYEN